jgi:hypothetical protein
MPNVPHEHHGDSMPWGCRMNIMCAALLPVGGCWVRLVWWLSWQPLLVMDDAGFLLWLQQSVVPSDTLTSLTMPMLAGSKPKLEVRLMPASRTSQREHALSAACRWLHQESTVSRHARKASSPPKGHRPVAAAVGLTVPRVGHSAARCPNQGSQPASTHHTASS